MSRLIQSLSFIVLTCWLSLSSADEQYFEYVFKQDDSIWRIADRYTTTSKNWYKVAKLNSVKLGPDRKIKPGTTIYIPVSMLKKKESHGVVILNNGSPLLLRDSQEERILALDEKLNEGDTVITKSFERVFIKFDEVAVLQIQPNSVVHLDGIKVENPSGKSNISVRLSSGSVYANVLDKESLARYVIKAPASGTAVRTDAGALRVDAGVDKVSRMAVTRGSATVTSGVQSKVIPEHYGLVAEKGKPLPSPMKLLPPPRLKVNVRADQGEAYIEWKRMDRVIEYRYELSRDESFNDIIRDEVTNRESVTFKSLTKGEYYLRVKAIHHAGLEGLAAEKKFSIEEFQQQEQDEFQPKDEHIYDDGLYVVLVWLAYLVIFAL